MTRVRSGLLVVALSALAPLGIGVPIASATDEQTCAALDQMSKAVDDPANNGPVITEALTYLRGENPAFYGPDRQIVAIGDAQEMWSRQRDAVRGNLDAVADPTVRTQVTSFADGLDGAISLAGTWIAATPEVRSSPDITERGSAVGGQIFDGGNNFHVQLNICNGGPR